MCIHVFAPNFQGKKSFILIFNSIFINLYLETKLMILFQSIILHMDIIIAF